MTDFLLPVAFSFQVRFTGDTGKEDIAFHEVSGLEAEIELELVTEGGENRFQHKLPKPVKHPNLILKRGIASKSSGLVTWFKQVIENDFSKPIEPRSVTIMLNDEEGEPLRTWSIARAYPVKWSIDTFNAMENKIAIETLELAYTTLKRL